MYICILPVDEDWIELMEANETTGLYITDSGIKVEGGRNMGDARTCWREFDTDQQRLIHQEDEHPAHIRTHREGVWRTFSSKQNNPAVFEEPIYEDPDPF
jgi:hypothetical protein